MTVAKSGRYGIQPAKRFLVSRSTFAMTDSRGGIRRLPTVAATLSEIVGWEVRPRTLRAWLDGFACPPAEIKLGLAALLGLEPDECWTPFVLASVYTGPRGKSTRTAQVTDTDGAYSAVAGANFDSLPGQSGFEQTSSPVTTTVGCAELEVAGTTWPPVTCVSTGVPQ